MVKKCDWIDLPDNDYSLILGYNCPNVSQLNLLTSQYSSLQKDCQEQLYYRIEALEKIVFHLTNWIKNEIKPKDKPKHLNIIKEIAEGKLNYLLELNNIYSNRLHEEPALNNYHFNCDQLKDKRWDPIHLNNQCFFSIKMKEYWGDFWLESLDPCHRRLTPFYNLWKSARITNPKVAHFFLWLETQFIPKYVPKVLYMEKDDLIRAEILIKDGLLCQRIDDNDIVQAANFNNPSERYLFAIDLDERIYVGTESDGYSHSSFTRGRPVLGAGLLTTKNGILNSISFESGHYLPTIKTGFQIINILLEKGVSLDDGIAVDYFYDRNKYRACINLEDLMHLERFNSSLEGSRSIVCQEVNKC